jgi:carbon storage regulator
VWYREVDAMLVLSRKVGEKILIGDHIEITVVRVMPNTVRLGVTAPHHCPIVREEIQENAQSLPKSVGAAPTFSASTEPASADEESPR